MLQTDAASCNRTDKVASIEGEVASIEGRGKQVLSFRDASTCLTLTDGWFVLPKPS
jgi:hypothetical protein